MPITVQSTMQVLAEQNDLFRNQLPNAVCVWKGHLLQGQCVLTRGVAALRSDVVAEIVERVCRFSEFTQANDPHGEHNFGAFEIEAGGQSLRVYWKFDYYDRRYRHGSPDPSDPRRTRRVLTILLASEY
jgi:hypothetical protein